jgi:sugar phosphate isomerase/epimerase
VPSFVYPASWADNARALGPYVDEMELIFFESSPPSALPTPARITELAGIAAECDLRYNVHLPLDIRPGSPDRRLRSEAIQVILQLMAQAAVLDPTTWTLHLPFDAPGRSAENISAWQIRIRKSLSSLLDAGLAPSALSIENLDYPFGWVEEIVADLGLSICMDIGHLILQGKDPGRFYSTHAERICILHLHGVKNGRDHLPLPALPEAERATVLRILASFSGTASIEVFSPDHLADSLEWLDRQLPLLS